MKSDNILVSTKDDLLKVLDKALAPERAVKPALKVSDQVAALSVAVDRIHGPGTAAALLDRKKGMGAMPLLYAMLKEEPATPAPPAPAASSLRAKMAAAMTPLGARLTRAQIEKILLVADPLASVPEDATDEQVLAMASKKCWQRHLRFDGMPTEEVMGAMGFHRQEISSFTGITRTTRAFARAKIEQITNGN